MSESWVALALRPNPGVWEYIRIDTHEPAVRKLSTSDYLQLKESLVSKTHHDLHKKRDGREEAAAWTLEIDLEPFNASLPRLTMPSSIGHGAQFLNRHLSSTLFGGADSMQPLFHFLRLHNHRGQTLMLTDGLIPNLHHLRAALLQAEELLRKLPGATPFREFATRSLIH